MKIKVEGKVYWVHGETVEVEMVRELSFGRVNKSFRQINPEGPVAKKVKAAHARELKLKEAGGCEGLEAKAVAAGVSAEMLGMWRRGSMSNEMLMVLLGGEK